jgi:hypothetical protein
MRDTTAGYMIYMEYSERYNNVVEWGTSLWYRRWCNGLNSMQSPLRSRLTMLGRHSCQRSSW